MLAWHLAVYNFFVLNNSSYLWNSYYVPGTVLRLLALPHSIPAHYKEAELLPYLTAGAQ